MASIPVGTYNYNATAPGQPAVTFNMNGETVDFIPMMPSHTAGDTSDETFDHLRRSVELLPRFRDDARRDGGRGRRADHGGRAVDETRFLFDEMRRLVGHEVPGLAVTIGALSVAGVPHSPPGKKSMTPRNQ